jgi:ERCC4-related helicase
MFFEHPLIIPQTLEAREYQVSILETVKKKNTLVVLPTGMGKTPLAIMLAAERLEDFSDSKVLIVAPTRPLCAQHEKSFREMLDLPKKQIALLTGQIPASNRYFYYKNCRVISATPQTIQNDLKTGTLNLKDFSLLIVDEVHRAVHGYAYPFVAKKYMEQARDPRVLGLTASPGGTEERINDIRRNLFSEAVEIRTETDRDVKKYVQETNVEIIKVDLSKELIEIQTRLRKSLNNKLIKLRGQGLKVYTRIDLLKEQQKFSKILQSDKRPIYFHIVSWCAEAIKIWHAVQLAETQSVHALEQYFERLAKKQDKSSQRIITNMKDLIAKIKDLDEEHPKIIMLRILIRDELKKNPDSKIIVFSHFRDNIDKILEELGKLDGCKPIALIGQSGERGLKQKEQINAIKDFEFGMYNVLVGTSISEEGLDIKSVNLAIFYDQTASEIRQIQRRGRVGRTEVGKVIHLITRKTSDESKHYASNRKEKKMKKILRGIQEGDKRGLKRFI